MKKVILNNLNYLYKVALSLKRLEIHTRILHRMVILSKKYLVKIPKKIKRSFCKKCYTFLIPTVFCKTRVKIEKKMKIFEVVCRCGEAKRFIL